MNRKGTHFYVNKTEPQETVMISLFTPEDTLILVDRKPYPTIPSASAVYEFPQEMTSIKRNVLQNWKVITSRYMEITVPSLSYDWLDCLLVNCYPFLKQLVLHGLCDCDCLTCSEERHFCGVL